MPKKTHWVTTVLPTYSARNCNKYTIDSKHSSTSSGVRSKLRRVPGKHASIFTPVSAKYS